MRNIHGQNLFFSLNERMEKNVEMKVYDFKSRIQMILRGDKNKLNKISWLILHVLKTLNLVFKAVKKSIIFQFTLLIVFLNGVYCYINNSHAKHVFNKLNIQDSIALQKSSKLKL